jgi:arginine/ornithine transport system permease protein
MFEGVVFQGDIFQGYLPAILGGLGVTLSVAGASLMVACVLGLLGALAKLSAFRVARAVAQVYTTVIRGLPDLVLMLGVFFGGQFALNAITEALGWPTIDVPPFAAGVLTIGFVFGAYLTETFRGAILAVPQGQTTAALALGLTRSQVLQRVVLPQMVRHAMPGFANNWLVMVKATALVSVIGLDDMLQRAQLAASSTRQPFTFFMLAAVMYLLITTLSIALLSRLEKRFSLGLKTIHF